MDPVLTKILEGIPYSGMGSTLERNALIGYIRNLINQDKYTVEMILSLCESVGYQRQMAEDVFKELTGLSPKLIINNNAYYDMPAGVPNMCIAWGISKSTKDKAYYIVPFEYGYATMETDGINAPIPTVISATIPEAFDELKKVAKNIQTLDKIITKKLLETENVQSPANDVHQVNLPYSASLLQVLKKNFKDKVLSVSEFERQASKMLQAGELTVDEAEDLMNWEQDLIDEDESYANEVLENNEKWNEVQATVEFEDIYNELKEIAHHDDEYGFNKNKVRAIFEANKDMFQEVDLIEAVNRLYQLLLGFSKEEILGHSEFKGKSASKKKTDAYAYNKKDYEYIDGYHFKVGDKVQVLMGGGLSSGMEGTIDEIYPYMSSTFAKGHTEDGQEFDVPISYLAVKRASTNSNIAVQAKKKASKKVKSFLTMTISNDEFAELENNARECGDEIWSIKDGKLLHIIGYNDLGDIVKITYEPVDDFELWEECKDDIPFDFSILEYLPEEGILKGSSKKVTSELSANVKSEIEQEAQNIIKKFKPYVIKWKANDNGGSVLIGDKNSDFQAWVDVWISGNDVDCDWNQYITHINDPKEYRDLQVRNDTETVFDLATSEAIYCLEQNNIIAQDETARWFMVRNNKKSASKKVTAENMTLDDIEAEDNKDQVQEEIEKINETPVEDIFVETTPEQYLDKALQEDKVDTINDVVSKCIDKFSEKFKDFDKYQIKILSYNTKVLGDYEPTEDELVEDKELNANAILQVILQVTNNADETSNKKVLAVFSITNGELHWTGTVRGENDQVVAFTEEGLDALFEVNEPSEEELEDII